MSTCPFKTYNHIFGEVGKGLHSLTFLGVNIIDNGATILGAILLTYFTKLPFPLSIILFYTAGIVFHMLFGVNTKTITYLGLTC